MIKGSAIMLVLACLLVSCSKEDPVQVTTYGPSHPEVQMILTAKRVYNANPYHDTILAGVFVQVYENDYNRAMHKQAIKYGTTDSTGRVTFVFLKSEDYYVEATYPGTDTAHITVTYPSGAVTSFEDLLMINH